MGRRWESASRMSRRRGQRVRERGGAQSAVDMFSPGDRVREDGEGGSPSRSGPGLPAPERGAVGQPTGATGNVPCSEGCRAHWVKKTKPPNPFPGLWPEF